MDYLKIYNILDSTNKEAHRLLAAGPVLNGLTLFARQQTDGRGQFGRLWFAEPGSHLAMTIIHQPDHLIPAELPELGMKVSLGIAKAIKNIYSNLLPLIKWPNDIYIGDKKLCGILIENSLSGSRVQHSIIGIGMNINESVFPDEIPNAVSLHQLTGNEYDVVGIAGTIRDHVVSTLLEPPANWKEDYDQYVFGKNKRFLFYSNDSSYHAEVIGVSMDGKLKLQMEDGHIRSVGNHEVKWVV